MHMRLTCHAVVYGLLLPFRGLYARSAGGIGRQPLWLKGNFSSDSLQSPAMDSIHFSFVEAVVASFCYFGFCRVCTDPVRAGDSIFGILL